MPVTTTGTLYLAPNDNWYTLWDNAGSLAVTIFVGAPGQSLTVLATL